MTVAAIIVLVVVVGLVAALALTRIPPDALLMAALTLLIVVPNPTDGGWQLGVVGADAMLTGFSNTGLATIAVLFVVVAGLRETGAVDWIGERVLGRPEGMTIALVRIILPVGTMSAFLHNTPVVAMMIPAVSDWAKRLDLTPSKLMIPLSYAAILGGTCSLIGTSTNLVVSGMAEANGHEAIGIFEITKVGLPAAIIGGLFLLLAGPKLLPDRSSTKQALSDPREYTLELMVPTGSPLDGKTIMEAGLRNLPGCFLVGIERDGEPIGPSDPGQVLRAGDRLLFAGIVDSIRDLQRMRGLEPATDQVFKLDAPRYRRRLFEAVVGSSSSLVGSTLKSTGFRHEYNGVVLAVARSGVRLRGRLGDITLRAGDTLLVEAEAGFHDRYRNSRDFLLVSPLDDSTPRRHDRAPIAMAILLVMVTLVAIGWLSMLQGSLIAAGAMVLSRCCTLSEARQSVDWSLLVVVGAAIGLGRALDETGAAMSVANGLISIAGTNPIFVLIAVYLVTSLATEIITNNGAVALVFPIAFKVSETLQVDFTPFVFAIMMAGSASFATPLGYQTNLMVLSPGGYRFSDYLRIGIPMNLLLAAVSLTLIPMIWPLVTVATATP
ncbi:MAG: SLC13 family permease [Phycisphaerales bacterium JB050]